MRKRTRLFNHPIAPLAILALLALPLAAGAQPGKGMGMGDPEARMEHMAEMLELTEEQRSQWKSMHEEHYPRMQELREKMQAQHQALREASEDGFDEEAAKKAARRLGDLVTESSLERARMHANLVDMLDDEQRAKMAELHDRMRARMGHEKHEGMKHKKDKTWKKNQDLDG